MRSLLAYARSTALPTVWARHSSITAWSASVRRREPRTGALGDELALELGQRGENLEDEPAIRGASVDFGARAGEHTKTDATLAKRFLGAHQVLQITTQPVELPYDERVAGL